MSTPSEPDNKADSTPSPGSWTRFAVLAFACILLWIAAASIQRSMLLAGKSRASSVGARSARAKEEIAVGLKSIKQLEDLKERSQAENDRLAKELKTVAEIMYHDQQLKPALKQLVKAVEIEEHIYGLGDPRTLPSLFRMSEIERELGNFKNASTLIERAINIEKQKRSRPDSALEILRARNNLSTIEVSRALTNSDPAKREQELRQALSSLKALESSLRSASEVAGTKTDQASQKNSLLAVNLQNQAFALNELGWTGEGRQKEAEAQTLRSALR